MRVIGGAVVGPADCFRLPFERGEPLLDAEPLAVVAVLESPGDAGAELGSTTTVNGAEKEVALHGNPGMDYPIGAIVMGMDTSNVDSVFIAGCPMKRNGQLLNVDVNNINKMVYNSRDYVIKASNFKLPAF